MRKQRKNKKAACGLCKPWKRGGNHRWKPKEEQALKLFAKLKQQLVC